MSIDGKLLKILCCPVSKTPLIMLTQSKLDKLNGTIASGDVLYVDGKKVSEPRLISEDGKVIYEIQDGIPVLLEEKGIGTTQFQDL